MAFSAQVQVRWGKNRPLGLACQYSKAGLLSGVAWPPRGQLVRSGEFLAVPARQGFLWEFSG